VKGRCQPHVSVAGRRTTFAHRALQRTDAACNEMRILCVDFRLGVQFRQEMSVLGNARIPAVPNKRLEYTKIHPTFVLCNLVDGHRGGLS
jgi:hypothetical protein